MDEFDGVFGVVDEFFVVLVEEGDGLFVFGFGDLEEFSEREPEYLFEEKVFELFLMGGEVCKCLFQEGEFVGELICWHWFRWVFLEREELDRDGKFLDIEIVAELIRGICDILTILFDN